MICQTDSSGGGSSPKIAVSFTEAERQMVVLALARLTTARPGFTQVLELIADKMHSKVMFESFIQTAGPPPGLPALDKGNQFEIVRQGDMIVALNLHPPHGDFVFTLPEAVTVAVWLANLADPTLTEFMRLSQEIRKP